MNSTPASPPPPSPRRRTPQPRRDVPPDSSDGGRRYPRRSTQAALTPKQPGRALALAPPPPQPQASESSGAARRNPVRSTRRTSTPARTLTAPSPPPPSAAPTPPPTSAAPTPPPPSAAPTPPPPPPSAAPTPPPPSAAPTPPPTSSSKSPLDAAQEQRSYAAAYKEDDKVINISVEELNSTLGTLGVSVAEKREVINTVLKKCLGVYNQALTHEKNRCLNMVKAISELQAEHCAICSVLGQNDSFSEELTETYQESASLYQVHEAFTASLRRLNVIKKQRLDNLHRMQATILDLWDHMGVTLDQQKEYRYIMRNSMASLAEVTDKGALSAALLTKIQSELVILEGQLIKKVARKFAVLAGNLRQTHLTGDEGYTINFTLLDVRDGRMDRFVADDKLEELVLKSAEDILIRESIVSRAEVVLRRVKEGSISVTGETVKNLINRVNAWESKHGRPFLYDERPLLAKLCGQERRDHYHLSDAVNGGSGVIHLPGEQQSSASAPVENAESPTRSDSLAEGSGNSGSDQDSDSDFSASESEED